MNTMRSQRLLAVLMAALIGSTSALAGPPPWAGGGKGGGDEDHGHKQKGKKGGDDRRSPQPGAFFNDRNRDAVHVYYANAGKGGKSCPPGLAKKNNGCMPPGQAKKWNVGQPLPSDVVWVPAPPQIVVNLPPVPVGHKYVQVAGDILLIAVGTKMVVDGINGLASR